jgi:hypothetical protein
MVSYYNMIRARVMAIQMCAAQALRKENGVDNRQQEWWIIQIVAAKRHTPQGLSLLLLVF